MISLSSLLCDHHGLCFNLSKQVGRNLLDWRFSFWTVADKRRDRGAGTLVACCIESAGMLGRDTEEIDTSSFSAAFGDTRDHPVEILKSFV
ncbi:hypothetical protein Y032_0060g3170 [Ancylostoma ceylanicum]|uniref:Uncharacterized protein n=1 Tax=Ancylostoma ceylanicum TaxID=53326 RepID=A0A016U4M9_9BILA|nr:hypothetical protein Y032_0060g3170 [Ancylostoma ceylanicum]